MALGGVKPTTDLAVRRIAIGDEFDRKREVAPGRVARGPIEDNAGEHGIRGEVVEGTVGARIDLEKVIEV